MPEPLVNASPRRRIARRIGAAGMALATLLVLGACKADGGGYVGEPFPGGPVGIYDGTRTSASTSPATSTATDRL